MKTEAAKLVTAQGWAVFPVHPTDKRPYQATGARHAENVCRDAEDVEAAWKAYPTARVGVSCHASGLLVVDIDGPVGEASWAEVRGANPESKTLSATTGREGGGRHLYFLNPDQLGCGTGTLGPGIDIRGSGGFVVAPPSPHKSGRRYAWVDASLSPAALPAWLLAALYVAPPPPRPARSTGWRNTHPADIYNESARWDRFLKGHGWTYLRTAADGNEHWERPGKTAGETGGTLKGGVFFVFTSSVPGLEAGQGYSLFGMLTALDYGGDAAASTAAVRRSLALRGYDGED